MTKNKSFVDLTEGKDIAIKIEMLGKALEDKEWVIEKTDTALKSLYRELKNINDELQEKKTSRERDIRKRTKELNDINSSLKKELAERKKMEESFKRIIEKNADSIIIVDMNGILRFVNPAAERLFNRKAEKLIGNNIGFPLVVDEKTELDILDSDKKIKVADMRVVEIEWEGENVYLASLRDFTEQKQTNDLIKKSKIKYLELYDDAPVGYHELDRKGRIVEVNRTEADMLGYTIQEMLGKSVFDFIDPEECDAKSKFRKKINKQLPIVGYEIKYICKNGKKIEFYIEDRLIADDKGKKTGMRSTLQDIAERKLREIRQRALHRVRESIWKMQKSEHLEEVSVTFRDTLKEMGIPFNNFGINVVDVSDNVPEIYAHEYSDTERRVARPGDYNTNAIMKFWKGGTPVYRRDIQENDEFGEKSEIEKSFGEQGKIKIRSIVDIPFSHGTIAINSTEADAFSEYDIDSLQDMANVLSEGFKRVEDLKNLEHYTTNLEKEIDERKQKEKYIELSNQVLKILNKSDHQTDLLHQILLSIKNSMGFEALGIRLRENDDFPYYETNGFPPDFIEKERYLCAFDEKGEIMRDSTGNPVLECMCGSILCGRFDPSLPFFTENGSFWTNSSSKLLASTSEEDRQSRTRNCCSAEGYESVALIPLRSGDNVIGLLQLNDHRPNCFSSEMINFFEGLGSSIEIALERMQAEEKIREYSKNMELKVEERTRALKKALKDTEEGRDRIDAILKSAAEGLIVTDIYNHIVLMNRAAENLLDVRLSDVIYRSIEFAVEDNTLRNRLKATLAQDFDNKFDFELFKNGSKTPLYMQTRTSVIHDTAGIKTGVTISFHDVTFEREVDRMKTEFISTAAHELRTPLTSIRGFSEILLTRDNIKPEEQKKFLNYINNQSIRLADIINDLLDISRIESGKGFMINREMVNINAIISHVVDFFRDCSIKHNFKVVLPDKPVRIKIDEEKIEQVLKNIISNAVKYSPSGGLIQTTGAVSDEYYVVTVTDQGVGMTAEQVEKIFDKFYRADSTNTAIEGTGLGMSIVKHIVESHGGKVWAKSNPGKGTSVKFTVPLKLMQTGKRDVKEDYDF